MVDPSMEKGAQVPEKPAPGRAVPGHAAASTSSEGPAPHLAPPRAQGQGHEHSIEGAADPVNVPVAESDDEWDDPTPREWHQITDVPPTYWEVWELLNRGTGRLADEGVELTFRELLHLFGPLEEQHEMERAIEHANNAPPHPEEEGYGEYLRQLAAAIEGVEPEEYPPPTDEEEGRV